MLEFQNVSVSHGRRLLLRDVSFGLESGKITVLLGKNGAGKSTLLRCVNGQQTYAGKILLHGQNIASLSPALRAREIGIFPQILPDTAFSVRTLVSLGRSPYTGVTGRLSDPDVRRVDLAMEQADAATFADRPVNSLSGGERQRAFLAMLLAQDTPILLMDEPTTYMDTDARRKLQELMKVLVRDHGKTLLAVMHDLGEAFAIADNAVILAEETMFFAGSAGECLQLELPEKVFGVSRYTACGDGAEHLFFR